MENHKEDKRMSKIWCLL